MKIRNCVLAYPWFAVVATLLMCFAIRAPVRADSAGMMIPAPLATTDGGEIYRGLCQGCHMADAMGAHGAGKYPALAKDPALTSATFVALTLLAGRSNMPAFGVKHGAGAMFFSPTALGYEQIAAVTNYVRTHFGNHYTDRIKAADVAALDKTI
jgi:mono/diheme cytochrome c family protein